MVIVMSETGEARQAAVVALPLPLLLLPFLLPSPDLVVHVCFSLHLLCSFPVGWKWERNT